MKFVTESKRMIQLVKHKEYLLYTYILCVKNKEGTRQTWGLLSKVHALTMRCWLGYCTTKKVSIEETVYV